MGEIRSIYQPFPEAVRSAEELESRALIEAEAVELLAVAENLPFPEVERQEREDNSRTALMEALTASGHLSRVEISGSLEEINAQVLRRLVNGYRIATGFHEKQRRFHELCNELVIQKLHGAIASGQADPSLAIAEISDYPEVLPDKEAMSNGYRALNKKGMVRSTHLRQNPDTSYTRIIETVSRSNGLAASSFAFLHGAEVYPQGNEPKDILVLKTPLLYSHNDLVEGAISVQARLDAYAGANVLYGEADKPEHVPYAMLRQESARREEQLELYVEKLANYEERLDKTMQAGKLSWDDRTSLYKNEVRTILRSICSLAPQYATDCFGEAAAPVYQEISLALARNDAVIVAQLHEQVRALEHEVVICGVMISPEQIEALGLQPDSLTSLTSEAKANWKWKTGVCQIPRCDSPKPTEVGPCNVCRGCQDCFDQGKDPTKVMTPKAEPKITLSLLRAA